MCFTYLFIFIYYLLVYLFVICVLLANLFIYLFTFNDPSQESSFLKEVGFLGSWKKHHFRNVLKLFVERCHLVLANGKRLEYRTKSRK